MKSCFIVGFLVVRHYEFMMHTIMREMYYDFLTNSESQVRMKIQVILHYVTCKAQQTALAALYVIQSNFTLHSLS